MQALPEWLLIDRRAKQQSVSTKIPVRNSEYNRAFPNSVAFSIDDHGDVGCSPMWPKRPRPKDLDSPGCFLSLWKVFAMG